MIKEAMAYIADELMLSTGLDKEVITLDSFLSLREKKAHGIVISLLNVEEEPPLKNPVADLLPGMPGSYQPRELSLNLTITIIFNFEDYATGLEYLTSVSGYLHQKPVYSRLGELENNSFPPGLDPFTLHLWNLTTEQLHQVWSICGGVHYPALFYKLRFLPRAQDEETAGLAINTNSIIREQLLANRESLTDINLK